MTRVGYVAAATGQPDAVVLSVLRCYLGTIVMELAEAGRADTIFGTLVSHADGQLALARVSEEMRELIGDPDPAQLEQTILTALSRE